VEFTTPSIDGGQIKTIVLVGMVSPRPTSLQNTPLQSIRVVNGGVAGWCCMVLLHFVAVSFAGAHSLSLELGWVA